MPDLTEWRCPRCANALYPNHPQPEKEEHKCWNTEELQRDFDVQGFQAPFVVVKRKNSGQLGSLEFSHRPRWYFNWRPHE